jgi:1-acyl-sn-glycerol-3-phosphate acyltransferase
MYWVKRAIWFPYEIWVGLTFVVFLSLGFLWCLPLYLLFGERFYTVYFRFLTYGSRVWFFLVGVRYRVLGQSHTEHGAGVIVGNHSSHIDLMNGVGSSPSRTRALAKASLKKVPLMGFMFSATSVFVRRDDAESRKKSVKALAEALKRGYYLFMFPEGTRNRTDKALLPFYNGAFKLAIEEGCPVYPLVILYARKVMPMQGLRFRPGKITVKYLRPEFTKGMGVEDVSKLRDKVFRRMEEEILQAEPYLGKTGT